MGRGDRLCFRLKSRFPVFYKDPGDSRRVKAFASDLSTSGMGILTPKTLEKDSVIDLQLGVPGRLRKITLRGRVVHQMWSKEKKKLLFVGLRFEEVPENVLDTITRFILKRLRMTGLRTFALLAGLAAFAAFLVRFLYFTTLGLFQGTAFGKEWLGGRWGSFPSDRMACYYAALAVAVLVACFCFFSMKRRAALGVFVASAVGLLDQGVRWALKIPYLFQDLPSACIFLVETGWLALWGALVWTMLRHGRNYEQVLDSLDEDAKFKPTSPPPAPKPIPPKVSHVFLP